MPAALRFCPSCGARFSQEAAFCPHDGSPVEALPEEAPAQDPMLGRVLDGRYEIASQLGEGGMGIVYLATHTVLGKKLAVKVLRGEMARDADVVQRFIQEAQTASSIGHPNIVDISDFGRLQDGSVYFVMEYLDGEPLGELIGRGGSVPMREAILIIEQIASALGAAHARGVVHRDMKPDNVFVLRRGDDPVVKVLDFGIAKVGGAGTKITKTGMVFGTPHYMSPEQAAGHAVDGRTDVYALGVIMYEMFTGDVPFNADTFMGILSKHMFEQPVPPSEAARGRQLGAIEDIIMRALAKKPEARYQTMDDMLADLAAVQQGGTVAIGSGAASSSSLANDLEPPSRTEMRLSGPDAPGLPGGRTRVRVLIGVAATVFVAALTGVVFALRGGDTEPAPQVAADSPGASGAGEAGAGAGEGDEPSGEPDADPEGADGLPSGMEPPEPSFVHVRSEPEGAQLFVDGALVGEAPARVPRPEEGTEHEVVAKKRGYRDEERTVTPTSPETLSLTLERERHRRREHRARRQPAPRQESEPAESPEPTEKREPAEKEKPAERRSMITREVVDPWSD